MATKLLTIIAGLFALLALGASIAIPFWILNGATGPIANLEIPLLAISGFLGVFASVALLVLAFNGMNLADKSQALGMPEGSVRALLAIFLVVTLGMAALFLLGQHRATTQPGAPEPKASATDQGGNNATAATTPAADAGFRLAATRDPAASQQPLPTEGTEPPTAPGSKDEKKGKDDPKKTATTGANNQGGMGGGTGGGDDLAKQFLTLVGGLVTTVVGFYFGSQTANSAATKGARAAADAIRAAKPAGE